MTLNTKTYLVIKGAPVKTFYFIFVFKHDYDKQKYGVSFDMAGNGQLLPV